MLSTPSVPSSPTVPFGPLGWCVWKRTYAREATFEQTIERCLDACDRQLHCGYTDAERLEFRDLLLTLKGSLAGRFLWQLGTETVDRLGLLSLQNCAAMLIDKPVRCYAWLFDALMLGVGVGFNLEQKTIRAIEQVRYCAFEHLHEPLPEYVVQDKSYDALRADSGSVSEDVYYRKEDDGDERSDPIFVVPDSREGWVRLLTLLLSQHFPIDGAIAAPLLQKTFRFNTILVRQKGAPITKFGGVASGHETLVWGLGEINRILNASQGMRPSSVTLLDVANLIGHIVVSGNVRRCLGAETPVWTRDPETSALRLKTMSTVQVGDLVWTHHRRWRRVIQTYSQGAQACYRLVVGDETYRVTGDHQLYVEDEEGGRTRFWTTAHVIYSMSTSRYRPKLVVAPMTIAQNEQSQTIDYEIYDAEDDDSSLVECYDLAVEEDASFVIGARDCIVVHNSAQIAVGSPDDREFIEAKRWDGEDVPPYWRSNSNNSVAVFHIKSLDDAFWELYSGVSEAYGLINLPLCRSAGQVGSDIATPKVDPDVVCVNPCGSCLAVAGRLSASKLNIITAEQPLCHMETCCLAEIFLPNCVNKEQLLRTSYYLYRTCKHSLALPCHWPETEAIVHRNMRMGISICGYLEATEEQRSWLPECALYLDQLDVEPSGTLSLLPGVTAGCHPAYARHYLKRMRVSKEWGDDARSRGYHVEPVEYVVTDEDTGQPLTRYDERTFVVDFPVTHKAGVVLAAEMTAIDQIKVMQRLQADWSDNAVSMTVYYSLAELPGIRRYLEEHYRTGIKGISFMLRENHSFRQAPWTEVTEQEYDRRLAAIERPFGCELDLLAAKVSHLTVADDDDLAENAECAGGA